MAGLGTTTIILELFQISFANQTLTVPVGLNHYEDLIPLSFINPLTNVPCDECLWVNVETALDFETRTLTLTLSALDPLTGWFPEDPLLGLLYPEDGTGRGQGSISYLVRAATGTPSGSEIHNVARIVFDYNDPIDTPQVRNTIDSGPPSSSIAPLPAVSDAAFLVEWSGDDTGGSGIANFDIYSSPDGVNYALWQDHTAG